MPEPGSLLLKEVLPKMGQIHRCTYHERHLDIGQEKVTADPRLERAIDMVLCKPKLLPMKSVTLEKLERMQREAQETVKEQEKQAQMESLSYNNSHTGIGGMGGGVGDTLSLSENPYDFG